MILEKHEGRLWLSGHGPTRIEGELTVPVIRQAVALLNKQPAVKVKGNKIMSWSIYKTGTREQVIEHARESKSYRSTTPNADNSNADNHDAVRDCIVEAVKALPPKFNCAMVEASGHVDRTGNASCKMEIKGLVIDFPVAAAPAPEKVAPPLPEKAAPPQALQPEPAKALEAGTSQETATAAAP